MNPRPSLHRFYAPNFDSSTEITLPRDEARHLGQVLRLQRGDSVRIFDGRGREWLAEVTHVGRTVRVRPLEPTTPAPEPAVNLTLAQAILKGVNQDKLVRDATMLGVATLQPLWSARTVASHASFRTAHVIERWRRIAIGACKQSGRAFVPDVRPPVDVGAFLASDRSDVRLLLVEPTAAIEALPMSALRAAPRPGSATVIVGPEGGWAADEIAKAMARGAQPLQLGGRTFRADAVPMIALAILLFLWGDL